MTDPIKAEGAPLARVPEWITSDRVPTDTELINFLQALTDEANYTGVVRLRDSETGRGWRLHETSVRGHRSVREAIIAYAVNRFDREDDGSAATAPKGAP